MKKLPKSLFGFVSFLFLLGIVSANGLAFENNTITINKQYGHDTFINLTIKNTDSFDFFNLSLEDNSYLEITEIPLLQSGESKTVEAKVLTDEEIFLNLTLKGFYESTIGSSDEIYNVELTYPEGSDLCSFTAIKGDSIRFTNSEDYEIKIKNTDNSETIKLLNGNEVFDFPLTNEGVLNYQLLRYGYPFGNPCKVNVLGDTGFINNPDLDAILSIRTIIEYEKTSISVEIPQSSYNISSLEEKQDLMKVTNNGNNIAKEILLEGEWFSFSDNKFDLNPGESKVISYKISPLGYITNSSETDKNYEKKMSISGNFDNYTKDFNVFIEYTEISDEYFSSSEDNLLEWIKKNYPELLEERVVIQYVDNYTGEINITTSNEKLDGLASAIFDVRDYVDEDAKRELEMLDTFSTHLNRTDLTNQELLDLYNKLYLETKEGNEVSEVLLMIFGLLFLGACLTFIILKMKDRNKRKMMEVH